MIAICTITSGNPDAHYCLSLLRSCLDLGVAGVRYCFDMVVGISPTEMARNEGVALFLEGDAKWLLFVDDDQVFSARDIVALREADKPIVGALIRKKSQNPLDYNVVPAKNPETEGPLVSVDAVGTGFLLIKREVILSMIDGETLRVNRSQRWPIFQSGVIGNEWCSEDFVFCAQARKLGFQSWVHAGLDVGHVGKQVFRTEHSLDQKIRMLQESRRNHEKFKAEERALGAAE